MLVFTSRFPALIMLPSEQMCKGHQVLQANSALHGKEKPNLAVICVFKKMVHANHA